MSKIPVALQLYTVREHTAKDFLGTLKAVAEMGYAGVEFAGYGNIAAAEMRKTLDDLGLVTVSSHIALADIEAKFDELVAYNQTLGNRFITIPHLAEKLRQSREDWVNIGARLNNLGARCKQKGMQLCYHNHAFEFVKYDDRYALDIMYGASGADLVQAELDIYWVKRGGEEPADYIRKMAGRCPLLHLKDMEDGPEQFFAEVGSGVIDLDSVFAAAGTAGVTCYIVEQDKSRRDSLESARISIDNLKARGMA